MARKFHRHVGFPILGFWVEVNPWGERRGGRHIAKSTNRVHSRRLDCTGTSVSCSCGESKFFFLYTRSGFSGNVDGETLESEKCHE